MKQTEGSRLVGRGLVDPDFPFDVVFGYEVCGLPEGHRALIKNLDHPRNLWSIWRFRNGIMQGEHTGSYTSAEDALEALQGEYPES
jgi:hypothetical protein